MDHCYVQLVPMFNSMNDVIVVEDVRPSNENTIRTLGNSIARQEVGPSDKNIICTSDSSIAHQEDVRSSNENIIIKKGDGDDYLIELYRERRCLYDANHRNFKNKQIKERAWREIAANMQQKNLGKHYTPKYCKIRCTSLRDQYSRGRRNIEKCKDGTTERKLEFFSQLSFLDKFIKRRRSFKKKTNAVQPVHINSNLLIHYKASNDASNDSTAIVSNDEHEDAMDLHIEEEDIKKKIEEKDINAFTPQDQKVLIKQIFNNCSKNIKTSKYREHRIDQSTSIDKISANIIELTNLLENLKENKKEEEKTPDQVFAEYICTVLKRMSEPEKSERKKLIIDALDKPLHDM